MRCSIIPTATRTAQPFPGIIGVSRVLSHMYLCSQRRLGSSLSSSYRSAARHRTSHAASSADRTLARRLSNITCGTAVRDFPFVAHSPASARILGDEYAVVFPDMITEEEEMVLMSDLEAVFKRKRYEKGHWDSVIEDYKESERLDGGWSPRSQGIVDAVRKMPWLKSFGEAAPWLPVHAIDLAPTGFIRPHVDSVKFSGGVVAGLSLLSSAVMRLTRSTDEDAVADLLLLPRSLYVLRGPARFEWAHAILPSDGGPISWHGRSFPRGRRVSLIFRDELGGSPPEPHPGTIGEGMATSTSTGAPSVGFVSTSSPHRTRGLLTRTIRTFEATRRVSPHPLSSEARDIMDQIRLTSSSCPGERRGGLDLATDGTLPNGERKTTVVVQRDDASPANTDSPAAFFRGFNESDHPLFPVVTVGALTLALATLLAPSDVIASSTTSAELVAQASASAVSVDVAAIFAKAGKASIGGGASGAAAAVVQVLSLMWLRTAMNFQYKNGGSTQNALQTLWQEGGVPRFYRGLPFALIQGPLSRFGDTAANVGMLALLEAFESTRSLPLSIKSAAGSLAAGAWRIGLTPIDTYKTTLQVAGAEGTELLAVKVAANGPGVLFEGALATATATFVGHYPWYLTYNALGASLPQAPGGDQLLKLGRQAFLGLCSSCVSDCCSNSFRVVKTTKQTASVPITYPEVLKQVIDKDGVVAGLLLRGLQTRILVNAVQGALFAVAWKYFEELIRANGGM